MCDTSTTQSTKYEMTPEEQELLAKASGSLDAYMEMSGFTPTTTTGYANPDLVDSYQSQLDGNQKRIDELQAQIATENNPATRAKLEQERNGLDFKNRQISTDLNKEKENTTTKVDYEMNEIGQKLYDQKIKSIDYQTEATDLMMENFKKVANGEWAISPSQQEFIDKQVASIKEPVFAMLDEVKSAAETTGKNMNEALDEYVNEIKATGLSVAAAISTVEDRIKVTKESTLAGIGEEERRLSETGQSTLAALKGVRAEIEKTGGDTKKMYEDTFALKTTLMHNDMKDMYDAQMTKSANQAAKLGRSPFDPQFMLQSQIALSKEITRSGLQLAIEESSALAGLTERTGQRLESLGMTEAQLTETLGMRSEALGAKRTAVEAEAGKSMEQAGAARVGLAETQGAKMEGVAQQRVGIEERTGAVAEDVARQKAAVTESTATMGSNLAQQGAIGIPSSMVGLGINVGQYTGALGQQTQSNLGTATQLANQTAAGYPTDSTTTTTEQGSPLGTILGVGGTAASMYGDLATGGAMGALK